MKGAPGYHIEVDDDPSFGSPERTADPLKSPCSATSLPFGVYYWHVATQDWFNQGAYSNTFSFEMTLNKSPKKDAMVKNGVVKFKWQGVKGASYLQQPLSKPTFRVDKGAPLPGGDYLWQFSIDGGSAWTPAWKFIVL